MSAPPTTHTTPTAAATESGAVWNGVLDRLEAQSLDCFQANLAAVADLRYGQGAHLALGALLRFATIEGPSQSLVAAPSLRQRLAEAAELLGLRVDQRWDAVNGTGLRRLADEHPLLYVVADAHDLDWLPYRGNEHMDHSFLLVGAQPSSLVIDAYRNATQWGDARPGTWRLSAAQLDACARSACAVTLAADGPMIVDRAAVLHSNALGLHNALPAIEAYVDSIERRRAELATMSRLVLDVWTLARSRSLHVTWLASTDANGAASGVAAAAHAQSWRALAAQSYVAMRRWRHGMVVPTIVIDELGRLLHADVRLAESLAGDDAGPAAIDVHTVQQAVDGEVRAVLSLGQTAVPAQQPLRELPGFDSFRLVEIIGRIEERLGVALEAEMLTGDSLRSIESLTRLFAAAQNTSSASER